MSERSYKQSVLKAIFSKSGNVCAFPNCNEKLVYDDYKIMGEIAHIEAFSCDGPRYNPNQTNDERNDASNLICLCSNHHKIIDSYPEEYTVQKIKDMKRNHEKKYDGTYNFNFEKIFKVNKELLHYMNNMQIINKHNKDYLKKQINTKREFNKIVKDTIRDLINIEEIDYDISEFMQSLNDKIISKLLELGYDTSEWDNDSEFTTSLWEGYTLGIPNNLNDIKVNLVQLEILYYYECLKTNNDKKIKKLLGNAKRRFKKYCKTAIVYD